MGTGATKYLSVLEFDGVFYQECKERLPREYTRWVKKCLSRNSMAGTWLRQLSNIQTDHVKEHRWPDVVVLDKQANTCHLVDIAVPADSRVDAKEKEKIKKYQDLARELRKV